jgi:hypothetical protein
MATGSPRTRAVSPLPSSECKQFSCSPGVLQGLTRSENIDFTCEHPAWQAQIHRIFKNILLIPLLEDQSLHLNCIYMIDPHRGQSFSIVLSISSMILFLQHKFWVFVNVVTCRRIHPLVHPSKLKSPY